MFRHGALEANPDQLIESEIFGNSILEGVVEGVGKDFLAQLQWETDEGSHGVVCVCLMVMGANSRGESSGVVIVKWLVYESYPGVEDRHVDNKKSFAMTCSSTSIPRGFLNLTNFNQAKHFLLNFG